MATETTREFNESSADMYRAKLPKDFAVLASDQDAWYCGSWASAERRVLFHYNEGDCTTTTCDTNDEFVEAVRAWAFWSEGMGLGASIRLREKDTNAWNGLGLNDLIVV